jgi:hypothetical protein
MIEPMVEYVGGIDLRPGKNNSEADLHLFLARLEWEHLSSWKARFSHGPFARFECSGPREASIELVQTGEALSDNRLVLKSGMFDLLGDSPSSESMRAARALYVRLFESLSPAIAIVSSGAGNPAPAPESDPVPGSASERESVICPAPVTSSKAPRLGVKGLLRRLPRLGSEALAPQR